MSDECYGKFPATIASYDSATRTCRVEIPGITNGGDVMPMADILYPIGDKSFAASNVTEIEILAGDAIWIEFMGGDRRYPIIVGYRNPNAGNSTGTRLFHHANIMLSATNEITLDGETLTINANVNITGTITNNGKDIGADHKHSGGTIGGNTGIPL